MSTSKPDVDALMVDWLYGELEPAEAARFEEHLARHPELKAEAEALRRTRAAFQDLGDAEPTDSLSAILMHEAALAVAPKTSLWSRFAAIFQPIFLHPTASAMATVVLLCGVAGALYLSGGARLAEPGASSTAAPPVDRSSLEAARDPSPQPASPAREVEAEDNAVLGYGNEGDFDERAYAVDLADEERQQAIAGAQEAKRAEPEAKPELAKILSSKSRSTSKRDSGGGAAGGLLADSLEEAEPVTGAATSSTSPKGTAVELGAARASGSTEKEAPSKADAWEQTQKQNLQQAAQSKRCLEVGRIANDILDKNSSFYKEEVENSQGAEDCRYYIASETQRRAKSRAKRAAARAKAKQGASVPAKAKAAPLESDRAAESN